MAYAIKGYTPCPDYLERSQKRQQSLDFVRETIQYRIYRNWVWAYPQFTIEEPDAGDFTRSTRRWKWLLRSFYCDVQRFHATLRMDVGR